MSKHTTQTRLQAAVDMSLEVMAHNFAILHSMAMAETAKRCDNGILDALNLIEVAQAEVCTLKESHYAEYDDCAVGFAHLGSLARAIALMIGQRDDPLGRAAQSTTSYTDVLLHLIEVAEGG